MGAGHGKADTYGGACIRDGYLGGWRACPTFGYRLRRRHLSYWALNFADLVSLQRTKSGHCAALRLEKPQPAWGPAGVKVCYRKTARITLTSMPRCCPASGVRIVDQMYPRADDARLGLPSSRCDFRHFRCESKDLGWHLENDGRPRGSP
jgi:hypothetical protein